MKPLLYMLLMISPLWSSDTCQENQVMKELKPCPKSPNCVCTQETHKRKQMKPLTFSTSKEGAAEILENLISRYDNAVLIETKENYYHYEFETKLGKFIDDVEFLIDPENKLIHFRSASRKGYGDLGKNRRRMKMIQKDWEVAEGSET